MVDGRLLLCDVKVWRCGAVGYAAQASGGGLGTMYWASSSGDSGEYVSSGNEASLPASVRTCALEAPPVVVDQDVSVESSAACARIGRSTL